MKIAALSRGREIDYRIRAWQRQEGLSQTIVDASHGYIDTNTVGEVAIIREDEATYSLIISTHTNLIDNGNRKIRGIVLFDDLSETQARQLAVTALHSETKSLLFADIANAFEFDEANTDYGWKVDFSALEKLVSAGYLLPVQEGCPVFTEAWMHDNNERTRPKIIKEVSENSFSKICGPKIVVTSGMIKSECENEIKRCADRYLWCGCEQSEKMRPNPPVVKKKNTAIIIIGAFLIALIVGMSFHKSKKKVKIQPPPPVTIEQTQPEKIETAQ